MTYNLDIVIIVITMTNGDLMSPPQSVSKRKFAGQNYLSVLICYL